MLYAFEDQQVIPHQVAAAATHSIAHLVPSQTVVQTISNPDGTVSLIQVSSAFTSLRHTLPRNCALPNPLQRRR